MTIRRDVLKAAALWPLAARAGRSDATTSTVHGAAAEAVRELVGNRAVTLSLMYPTGSLENVAPVMHAFTEATGVQFRLVEVPVDEINEELLLEAERRQGSFDIAIPATFGLPDLVESGIVRNLDAYVAKYEPEGFQNDVLFTTGDYYKGSFYGYQTDGDSYLMFYLRDWLEDPEEQKRFADRHGYPLAIPSTWEELDTLLAWFHRPSEGRYGGALFRTELYGAWEWWVRFHAKGYFPFDDELNPQINNEAGIEALEAYVAASKYLHPGAATNGLFENFQAYGRGRAFCNIGWGGTQKYLNGPGSNVKGRLAFGPTPGGVIDGKLVRTPYFNWGWNYVVSSLSEYPEVGYLFMLFAASPRYSTISVREPGGFFDPFRAQHYRDSQIVASYTKPFLEVHESSMRSSIPDLYLKGQVEYFDELRINVKAADLGEKTPREALDDTARAWNRITDRMGRRSQKVQWQFLKSTYPTSVRAALT